MCIIDHFFFQELWRDSIPCLALETFLTQNIEATILKECNFNNCYWIPSDLLKSFIVKCTNIETLGIAETQLDSKDLPLIFSTCKKVTELSISLHESDPIVDPYASVCPDSEIARSSYPSLESCGGSLKKLKKLEILFYRGAITRMAVLVRYSNPFHSFTICNDLFILMTIYSYCDNLKELILFPVHLPSSYSEYETGGSCVDVNLMGKFSLHSFIVGAKETHRAHSSSTRYTYLRFKADMNNMDVFWSDVSKCRFTSSNSQYSALSSDNAYNTVRRNRMEDENFPYGVFEDHLKQIDLKKLTSVKENSATFIPNRLHAPQVKLISCYYSREV